MRVLVSALVGMCMWGAAAWAATDSLSLSAPEGRSELKTDNVITRKFEEDKRITDLELRALEGSMRRFSLQFNFGYTGSAVNDLADPHRPNPDNRPGDQRTFLSGNASLRYRFNPNTAVNFGTGLSFYEPFQAVQGKEQDRPDGKDNYGANDPFVSLDRTYKAAGTQMRTSLKLAGTTTQAYTRSGQWGAATVQQYFKFVPGTTRMILGLMLQADYFAYNREYIPADRNVSKYYLNFIPSFEYKLSDVLNFNTSLGYPYQNLRKDDAWWRWNHPLTTWRVGVGYAFTKDIYFNPYVNFFAETPAFNTASLNFNTTFAIF